jgi:hypothetical protein
VVKFRWLEPKGGDRWARGLLWVLVIPGELVGLTFVYIGIRPLLLGSPIVGPLDGFDRFVVTMMMVMLMVVVLLFGAVYRIQHRMYPFRRIQAHRSLLMSTGASASRSLQTNNPNFRPIYLARLHDAAIAHAHDAPDAHDVMGRYSSIS